jgi:hypothetical protein
MRAFLPLLLSLAVSACGDDPVDDTQEPGDTDTDTDTDTDSDSDADTDADTDPKAIGREAAAFAMEDINPSSPSFGAVVDSQDLVGAPYGLLFMDSRCTGCIDLANDVWGQLVEHPGWAEALPIFGVESFSAYASAQPTIDPMVADNDLPYLVDIEENTVWGYYSALNHDFIVVSAEGTIEAWLPLYSWPDDLVVFTDWMSEQYGD